MNSVQPNRESFKRPPELKLLMAPKIAGLLTAHASQTSNYVPPPAPNRTLTCTLPRLYQLNDDERETLRDATEVFLDTVISSLLGQINASELVRATMSFCIKVAPPDTRGLASMIGYEPDISGMVALRDQFQGNANAIAKIKQEAAKRDEESHKEFLKFKAYTDRRRSERLQKGGAL